MIEFNIKNVLKMDLKQLESLYNSLDNKVQHREKAVVKGLILSKTNYGSIQEELF